MITKKQKLQIAYLTGYTPVDLRNEEVVAPTDDEIKNLILLLPNDFLHKIYIGKYGDQFKRLCNEAMYRISMRDIKQPSYGRSVSSGVVEDVELHELGQNTTPLKA
jgi:hypothetical protein